MKFRLTFFIPIICLMASCSKESLTEITVANASALGKDSVFSYTNTLNKDVMLTLLNDVRSKGCNCGSETMPAVAPLKWSQRLEKAAWLHSKEMSDSNYISHTSKNGSDAGDRIKALGYNWKTYCENIAIGHLTEQEIIHGWLKSPAHCKALMNAKVTETGIGRYSSFWTQELATR